MYDYSMQFVNASNNFSVASYQGGPFLAQLLQLFTMITNNRPLNSVPVFSIHATHDTTIKPILNFFGLVPPPHSIVSCRRHCYPFYSSLRTMAAHPVTSAGHRAFHPSLSGLL
jgi:hypothetical protein